MKANVGNKKKIENRIKVRAKMVTFTNKRPFPILCILRFYIMR